MSYAIDRNTGRKFKRTETNYPHGSISRVKVGGRQNKYRAILAISEHATILPLVELLTIPSLYR